MFFCIDIGVDVDVDGNVAINVGKYLETNCWKWEASISRAQPPTVLSDFLHFCHWPESLLIKIEKFKRKRFTIIKLCLSLFVIVVIFVFTVFFTFAFHLILPQKWGLHIIMSSNRKRGGLRRWARPCLAMWATLNNQGGSAQDDLIPYTKVKVS